MVLLFSTTERVACKSVYLHVDGLSELYGLMILSFRPLRWMLSSFQTACRVHVLAIVSLGEQVRYLVILNPNPNPC
jgi:hypothetical protein